jgi:hypothetical protein
MQINFKTISLIALIILAMLGSFAGGIWFSSNITAKLFNPSYTKEVYARAITKQLALEQLDKNNIEKGHYLIKTGLMGDIITLDNIYESDKNEEMRNKIKGLLHRIALNREKFPHYYSGIKNENSKLENAYSIVDEILKKYLKNKE